MDGLVSWACCISFAFCFLFMLRAALYPLSRKALLLEGAWSSGGLHLLLGGLSLRLALDEIDECEF